MSLLPSGSHAGQAKFYSPIIKINNFVSHNTFLLFEGSLSTHLKNVIITSISKKFTKSSRLHFIYKHYYI